MINRRCGIGIAAEIELLRTGLRVRFVLSSHVVSRKDNAAVTFYLHFHSITNRVVDKKN